jgi:ribosomal protein S18 acetylase RimI-like enzyme
LCYAGTVGSGAAARGAGSKLALMRQTVTFTELGPAEFRSAISGFIAVYTAAMNPPERMLAGREAILDRHAANPGFRALAALLARGGDPPGAPREWGGSAPPHTPRAPLALAGFTYGFHGVPGQWWHDTVVSALTLYSHASASRGAGGGGPRVAADGPGWLDDSFEVAELHVMPSCQGKGIGRELLLRLTSGRPEHTAVLSTADAESRARRLYRGVGFTDLLTGFRFSGGEPPYAVMGARLPLLAGSAAPRSPRPSS